MSVHARQLATEAKIRVLLVDDSATVRQQFRRILDGDPMIEVVGVAPDAFVGRDLVVQLKPDVLVLDIEMPRMDGLSFLRRLMKHQPMPVVIASSLTPKGSALAVEAMDSGAAEVMCKGGEAYSAGDVVTELRHKVKAAAVANVERRAAAARLLKGDTAPKALAQTTHKVVAIGASTGGTVAIEAVLSQLPPNAAGTVIAQHMPPAFSASFAERLNGACAMQVSEAVDGEPVTVGKVLIAPGDKHMLLRRSGAKYYVAVKDGPLFNRFRPSVDILFRSVAETAGRNAIGVLLTGMGRDGAKGLRLMQQNGARTVAQDENSCVVYGMPKAAVELGAADEVVPLGRIGRRVVELYR